MRQFATRPAVRWIAIGSAAVNLEIHVVLAFGHWREMPYIGAMFVIAATLLGLVVAGLSSGRDSRRTLAWIGGSIVSAGEFILFVLSRTTGLPGDYREAWMETPEDLLGLLSLLTEAVFIACAALSLPHQLAPRPATDASGHRLSAHDRTAPSP